MQSTAKPKATDDPHDFVVVPSDQVQVAPCDEEITDLLRAAARQRSESGSTAVDQSGSAPVPAVDTTFRATAVNDDVLLARGRSPFGRRAMRAIAALVLAIGITAAAAGWQVFGYAAKKTFGRWLPQLALNTSLPLDKLGLGTPSQPAEPAAAEEMPAQAGPAAQAASDSTDVNAAAPSGAVAHPAVPPSDSAQLLQSMARDLANVRQEVETLKAGIAELKASQQQMTRDRTAEQNAKPRMASAPPRPVAARKPAPAYSPTPTPLGPAPAYRAPPSYAPTQAAVSPAPNAQPYVSRQAEPPPTVPIQPQTEQPGFAAVPRPPMPVQ